MTEILGKTSLVLEDLETGKKITRHLSDCYPIKPVGNYSNLFLNSKAAVIQDVEEDFGGMSASNLPGIYLDGVAVDEIKKEELAIQKPEAKDDEPSAQDIENWSKRLRKGNSKVNYKK